MLNLPFQPELLMIFFSIQSNFGFPTSCNGASLKWSIVLGTFWKIENCVISVFFAALEFILKFCIYPILFAILNS